MWHFVSNLFDTSDFNTRWDSGNWTAFHGWLHIVSDLLIWGAFMSIPVVLAYFILKRKDVVFPRVFWLFAAFIFVCGAGHLIEAGIFYWPVYRVSGLVKLSTAVVSWATVVALVRVLPRALALPGLAETNKRLHEEIQQRKRTEDALRESEQRFRTLCQHVPVGIYLKDAESNCVYVNDQCLEVTGLMFEQVAGPAWVNAIHPHDRDRIIEQWMQSGQLSRNRFRSRFRRPPKLLASFATVKSVSCFGTVPEQRCGQFNVEYRFRSSDGKVAWVQSHSVAIAGDNDTAAGFIGTLVDVTDRLASEEALRQSRQQLQQTNQELASRVEERAADLTAALARFESIAQHVPDCFWSMRIDENGTPHVEYVSPAWQTIWGYTPEEIYADADLWLKAIVPEDLPLAQQAFDGAIASNQRRKATYRIRSKHGELRWIEDTMTPSADGTGRVNAMDGIARDITERKLAEVALRASEVALAERAEFKQLLLQLSSHFVTNDPREVDAATNQALAAIGQFATANRSYLFEFSADSTAVSNTHEWCAHGIEPHIDNLQDLPVEAFPWMTSRLLAGDAVEFASLDQLPPEAGAERDRFMAQSIQSLVCVPIRFNGRVAGFIGFDSVRSRRDWGESLHALLQIVGDLIINAERRLRAEQSVRHQTELLEEAQSMAHLGNWEWDVQTNQLTWSDELYRIYGLDPQHDEISLERFMEMVHPDDREAIQQNCQRTLETGEPFAQDERIRHPDGSERILLSRGHRVRDEHGQPVKLRGTCQDVTEQRFEELRFRGLLEAAPDAMVIVDETGTITLVNEQAERLFGYDREELLGKPVELLVPESAHRRHVEQRKRFFQAPSFRPMGRGFDLRAVRKDGSVFPVEISLSPLETPRGRLVTASIRDTSDRAKSDEELRRSRQHLDDAQRVAGVGSWEWNVKTNEVWWSDQVYRMYAVEKGEYTPSLDRFLQFLIPEDRQLLLGSLQTALDDNTPYDIPFRVQMPDGSITYHVTQGKVERDEAGQPLRMVGTDHDVTEQRQIESQLRRVERLASLGTLAAGIAHEINNPMSAAWAAAETAKAVKHRPDGAEMMDESLDAICSAVQRCQVIIENVLRFSRQESSQKEPSDINEIVRAAVAATRYFVEYNGAVLDTQLASDVPPATVNAAEIEQVLVNLIRNAVQSGEHATISISTNRRDNWLLVRVTDKGRGMSDDDVNRIFDPFFTGKNTAEGVGLGLTISHGIIENHGGRVDVESRIGKGSTFTVVLPLAESQTVEKA